MKYELMYRIESITQHSAGYTTMDLEQLQRMSDPEIRLDGLPVPIGARAGNTVSVTIEVEL